MSILRGYWPNVETPPFRPFRASRQRRPVAEKSHREHRCRTSRGTVPRDQILSEAAVPHHVEREPEGFSRRCGHLVKPADRERRLSEDDPGVLGRARRGPRRAARTSRRVRPGVSTTGTEYVEPNSIVSRLHADTSRRTRWRANSRKSSVTVGNSCNIRLWRRNGTIRCPLFGKLETR